MLLEEKRAREQLSHVGSDRHRICGLLAKVFKALSSLWRFPPVTAGAAHSEDRFYRRFCFLAVQSRHFG